MYKELNNNRIEQRQVIVNHSIVENLINKNTATQKRVN